MGRRTSRARTDVSHSLTVSAATTTTAAVSAVKTFSSVSSQNVALSATVTSAAGTVNEGTETFTILSGSTVIGAPVTANVGAGAASTSYPLPAGLQGGSYTIQAVYNDTANYATSTDTTHVLTINAAGSTTAANSTSTTFSVSSVVVALSSTVSSAAGTINEGTETFTILQNTTAIGSPVTVNVVVGAASANYTLPGGTQAGSYTIKAVYNGTVNYATSTDTTHVLTINGVAASTAAASAAANFSATTQNVGLIATVSSSVGTVNEGTETFTILQNTTVIGSPVMVNVVAGAASASYPLPAGLLGGGYIIQAVYNGTVDFATCMDNTHILTINGAATATAAASASATFSATTQNVGLSATVSSASGTVNAGTETFTILQNTTVIGSPVTVSVVSGAASASYALPAGQSGGSYTIQAVYNGAGNFATSTDTTQVLTINAAATAAAANSTTASFSVGSNVIVLSSTVSSASGTVNAGMETFTILQNTTVIGSPVTVSVAAGAASA